MYEWLVVQITDLLGKRTTKALNLLLIALVFFYFRYPVSSFSYRLLDQMFTDPLFRIFELNKNISKRSKSIVLCRKYRFGLHYMKDFIFNCRFAET